MFIFQSLIIKPWNKFGYTNRKKTDTQAAVDMARYVDNSAVLLLRFYASSLLGNFALE